MNTDNEFNHNKAYLMQYRRMHTKIDRLKDKLERLNERYNLKGVSYSSQPSSTVTQTLDDILAQKEYIEGKISKLTGDAIKISNEIQDRLLELDNQLEAEILDLYFLENHSLNEIANILCYSERQIERLYVKGIKHLFK